MMNEVYRDVAFSIAYGWYEEVKMMAFEIKVFRFSIIGGQNWGKRKWDGKE
jgi:hypothetical protein